MAWETCFFGAQKAYFRRLCWVRFPGCFRPGDLGRILSSRLWTFQGVSNVSKTNEWQCPKNLINRKNIHLRRFYIGMFVFWRVVNLLIQWLYSLFQVGDVLKMILFSTQNSRNTINLGIVLSTSNSKISSLKVYTISSEYGLLEDQMSYSFFRGKLAVSFREDNELNHQLISSQLWPTSQVFWVWSWKNCRINVGSSDKHLPVLASSYQSSSWWGW